MSNTKYVRLVCVNVAHKQLVVQLFMNQGGEVNCSPREYLECYVKVCSSLNRNREKILRVCGLNPWLSGGVGQHVLVPRRRE